MPTRPQIARRLGSDEGELLGALLSSMVDAVYAVDEAGVVLFANPAAVSILGYDSESQLIGRQSHATIHYQHPDGRPFAEADCPLLAPRQTGEPVRVDQDWFIRRDGSFVPVAYSSAPVTFEGRRGAVVVFRDVSERRRAEAERLRAEAIHASRARIVQAALDERRRLGRDLHDGAQQRLINVIFALQAAGRDPGGEESRNAITDALQETQLAIRDLRDLGAGLDPSVLAHRGLAAAITSLTARTPVPVTLDLPSERFPPLVESTAYFVVAGSGPGREVRPGGRCCGCLEHAMEPTEEPDMTEAIIDRPTEVSDASSPGMLVVRYGLGGVMILGGVVMLIVSPASLGVDGFAMAVGGGLSVVLLNFLFRLSVSSEADRAEEEQARAYFDEHGDWPEEKPRQGRKWVLPAGVVTYEMEQEQLRTRQAAEDRLAR